MHVISQFIDHCASLVHQCIADRSFEVRCPRSRSPLSPANRVQGVVWKRSRLEIEKGKAAGVLTAVDAVRGRGEQR